MAELNLGIDSIWLNCVGKDITMYFGLRGSAIGISLTEEELHWLKKDVDKIIKFLEEQE